MNLPNKLTILRLFLALFFIVTIFIPAFWAKALALIFFISASVTDFLDGYVAKKYDQKTDFGAIMDPVADKVLVISAFLAFVQMQIIPAWMVAVIMAREILLTGLRFAALAKGVVVSADRMGKHKTISQMIVIFIILIFIIFRSTNFYYDDSVTDKIFHNVIYLFMSVAVVLTVYSGLTYIIRNRRAFFYEKIT